MIQELNKDDILFDNKYRNQEQFLEDLSKNYKYLGYFLETKLVAYLCYYLLVDEYEIHYIATLDEYQQQGYASQLLNSILLDYPIFLEVNESNDVAINFYQKHGFKIINRRTNYYGKDDALIMQRKE